MNEDLRVLHATLGGTLQTLSKRLDETGDREEADALIVQMRELNRRITRLQGKLFQATSDLLTQRIHAVTDGTRELQAAVRRAEKAAELVRQVGNVLEGVDRVLIGLA